MLHVRKLIVVSEIMLEIRKIEKVELQILQANCNFKSKLKLYIILLLPSFFFYLEREQIIENAITSHIVFHIGFAECVVCVTLFMRAKRFRFVYFPAQTKSILQVNCI